MPCMQATVKSESRLRQVELGTSLTSEQRYSSSPAPKAVHSLLYGVDPSSSLRTNKHTHRTHHQEISSFPSDSIRLSNTRMLIQKRTVDGSGYDDNTKRARHKTSEQNRSKKIPTEPKFGGRRKSVSVCVLWICRVEPSGRVGMYKV